MEELKIAVSLKYLTLLITGVLALSPVRRSTQKMSVLLKAAGGLMAKQANPWGKGLANLWVFTCILKNLYDPKAGTQKTKPEKKKKRWEGFINIGSEEKGEQREGVKENLLVGTWQRATSPIPRSLTEERLVPIRTHVWQDGIWPPQQSKHICRPKGGKSTRTTVAYTCRTKGTQPAAALSFEIPMTDPFFVCFPATQA